MFFKKITVHIVLPLLVGLFIYCVARPDAWFVQRFGLSEWISLRQQDGYAPGRFFQLIINSGPDFCWSYSLASALIFWRYKARLKIKYFPVYVMILMIVQEAIQLLLPAYFTFDLIDLVAAISAVPLSWYLNRRYV